MPRVALVALLLTLASVPSAHAERRPVFRFTASSALFARPGLGADGSVYVGSGDGYVHALGPDGSYRWSYALKGRVTAPPVEEPSHRRVFVVTSEARLYALEPDSHLRWVFPLPVAPKSELALTPTGTLLFVGQDDHLYGVTTGGALTLRLAAPLARSSPTLLGNGRIALVLGDSLATLKGYGYARAPLPGAFDASARLVVAPDGSLLSCEDGRVRAVSSEGTIFEAQSDCLSAPVRGAGFFAVAEASGEVRLFGASKDSSTIGLGAAPLRPIWDGARRRLVLATATGTVQVVELREAP